MDGIERCFESTLDGIRRWEDVDQTADLLSDEDEEDDRNETDQVRWTRVHALSRKYISLYGSCPKMESKIYSSCKLCGLVFNPRAVSKHREFCVNQGRVSEEAISPEGSKSSKPKSYENDVEESHSSSSSWKRVRPINKQYTSEYGPKVEIKNLSACKLCGQIVNSQSMAKHKESCTSKEETVTNRSKVNSTRESASGHTSNSQQPVTNKHKKISKFKNYSQPMKKKVKNKKKLHQFTNVVPLPPLFNRESQNWSQLPSRFSEIILFKNKAKKLKKGKMVESKSKSEGNGISQNTTSGPCTRSISNSAEKSHTRKSPSSRNRHKSGIVDSRRSTKESRHTVSNQDVKVKPQITVQNAPTNDVIFTSLISEDLDAGNVIKTEAKNEVYAESNGSVIVENGYCTVEKKIATPVLFFRPISPIFLVTPLQCKENNVQFIETHSEGMVDGSAENYFVPIPEPTSNIKLCTSHPKPTVLPTFGARKIGGAILGSNQRLEYQLKDIQAAINSNSTSSCKTTSYNVPASRSILIKGINNKVICKKSPEKLSASDSKRTKLAPDVNGFIIHTELSDVAETPQSNHCIQENINLLNMK